MLFVYIIYLFCCVMLLIALIAGAVVAYTYRKQLFKSAVWVRELRKMFKQNSGTSSQKTERHKEPVKPKFEDAEYREIKN